MSFHLPHDPNYSLTRSARDSVRFVTERCLEPFEGRLRCPSSFVDIEGNPMRWHDFGTLEGPGWAANLVGGAEELLHFAEWAGDAPVRDAALKLLDHALLDGFFRESDGLMHGYRDVSRDALCHNFKHNDDWLCPGSMARVGSQLLEIAERLRNGADSEDILRRERALRAAEGIAAWIAGHVRLLENGWLPRRVTPDGEPYRQSAEGGPDPFFDSSGDGIFILQLFGEMEAERGISFAHSWKEAAAAFVEAGGWFGSINHDTYDARESVAYSVAFRAFLRLSRWLEIPEWRRFAYDACLASLERYKMREDRNGVATRGLLWMEETWDTAYLWESAEASLAWLDAWEDSSEERYLSDSVTVLRAIAKHHRGPHGFLTEGVDWNDHVGRRHHFREDGSTTITRDHLDRMPTEPGAEFGDIQYTEPLLNHLHHVSPTMTLLEMSGESALERI